jgi:hypothetical protein
MKKIFSFLILYFWLIVRLHAQLYNSSLGARLGSDFMGVTYKYFLTNEKKSIEAMLMKSNNLYIVSGLYELNKPIFNDYKNLNWFLGAGLRIASGHYGAHENINLLAGVQGIFGFEYGFLHKAPIAIALDINPVFNLNGGKSYSGFWFNEACLTIRYTFSSRRY